MKRKRPARGTLTARTVGQAILTVSSMKRGADQARQQQVVGVADKGVLIDRIARGA